jgi:hypothetical protein
MRIRILAIALACLSIALLLGCSSSPVDKAKALAEKTENAKTIDDSLISDYEEIFDAYISLQKKANDGDEEARKQAEQVDTEMEKGFKSLDKLVKSATKEQRDKIIKLNEKVIKSVREAGLKL